MRRKNPITGENFKQGDTREDGFRFVTYVPSRKRKNGFFVETWASPEAFENRLRERKFNSIIEGRKKNKKQGIEGKKRLNPRTNQLYKSGDWDDTGTKRFERYDKYYILKDGYCRMTWETPDARRNRLEYTDKYQSENFFSQRLSRSKKRAKQKGVPHNITKQYITDIFPEDGLCPALGVPLVSRGEEGVDPTLSRQNSPSLDRIIPDKGYVEGNVVWLSFQANMIKGVSNAAEIRKVADWLDELESQLGEPE